MNCERVWERVRELAREKESLSESEEKLRAKEKERLVSESEKVTLFKI